MRTTAIIALLLSVTVAAFGQTGIKNTPNPLNPWSLSITVDTNHFPLQVFADGKKVATFKTDSSFTIYDSPATIKQLAKYGFGSKPNVVHKADTVQVQVPVPVYLYDITDTVKARVMYKKSEKSDRIYQTDGFVQVRGFKTLQNGQAVWLDKPQIIGALDNKKKAIAHPIQLL